MYSWGNSRRYNSYVGYFKKVFGGRMQKLSIHAGFTCPNRDGTLGSEGCTFCNNEAFNPSYCKSEKTITQQLKEGKIFHETRYKKPAGYLAYFQAYSNTYATLEILKKRYEEAILFPGIKGLVIGTRPDCIDDSILDYLSELSKKMYVIIEYGIESCYDKTLQRIKRGHDFQTSVNAILKTSERNISVGAHIIFGLPGENRNEMIEEATILSDLPVNNLKIHQLQIIKDTVMAKEYAAHPERFSFFELEDYLELVVKFVEKLNPRIVIERIAGEAPPDKNITPVQWKLRNDVIIKELERKLDLYDTWQGKFYNKL